MEIMGWIAVGLAAWMALSVPLALIVGRTFRAGGGAGYRAAARRAPAHVRHGLGCGQRVVADAA